MFGVGHWMSSSIFREYRLSDIPILNSWIDPLKFVASWLEPWEGNPWLHIKVRNETEIKWLERMCILHVFHTLHSDTGSLINQIVYWSSSPVAAFIKVHITHYSGNDFWFDQGCRNQVKCRSYAVELISLIETYSS